MQSIQAFSYIHLADRETEKSKNLIFDDEAYALEMLKQVEYFKLIGGYKNLFKNKTTHKYKDNTHFDDIVKLYV